LNLQYKINHLISFFSKLLILLQNYFLSKTLFLSWYYTRSENLWNDGYLFDFLQKKTFDSWIRQFVIYTGFLFSERFVFDIVIKLYIDNIIWPLHKKSILESSNVVEILSVTIILYYLCFLILFFLYLLILI
jgi:hypothetical protein